MEMPREGGGVRLARSRRPSMGQGCGLWGNHLSRCEVIRNPDDHDQGRPLGLAVDATYDGVPTGASPGSSRFGRAKTKNKRPRAS